MLTSVQEEKSTQASQPRQGSEQVAQQMNQRSDRIAESWTNAKRPHQSSNRVAETSASPSGRWKEAIVNTSPGIGVSERPYPLNIQPAPPGLGISPKSEGHSRRIDEFLVDGLISNGIICGVTGDLGND